MIEIKKGATRVVFLMGNMAFKFPRLFSWKIFLNGLLANMQECELSILGPEFCPIKWYIPGGFLVVMPRAKPLSDHEWSIFSKQVYVDFVNTEYIIPVERKQCSFGWIDGRIVAVDYG